jgi:N-acetylglucosamine malate deacetylase 1
MKNNIDILAFGAHPDDVELSCSGTLLKHISIGYSVAIADLTRGELGTRGNATLRKKEAELAAKIMGVKHRENISLPDGFFEISLLKVITVIRKYKPKIVLTNALKDRHPDHGRGAKLVSEACFLSGLVKIKTGKQEPHRPLAVYHYIQDRYIQPDFVVDITPFIDKKMEAIKAYSSQFYNPNSKERETPISAKNFFDYVKQKHREYGRFINVEFAEGFVKSRALGVEDILSLK